MKMSQVLAREQQEKARVAESAKWFGEGIRAFVMAGFSRQYTPLEEGGEQLPPEEKLIQHDWLNVIGTMRAYQEPYVDAVAAKDFGNCAVSADVVIDGRTILEGAPVPYLLFLEKLLGEWRGYVSKLPQRDKAQRWSHEGGARWQAEPITQNRTVDQQVPIVLYDATKEHPAQTQIIKKRVLVGHYRTVNQSGEPSFEEKERLIARVDRLLAAVRKAREEANSQSVESVAIASTLFDYIFEVEAS